MTTPSSPEQQAFEQSLEDSKDVLEGMADEAMLDPETLAGLDDPNRDDEW